MHMLVLAAAVTVLRAGSPPPDTHCPSAQPVHAAQHAPVRMEKLGELPDADMDLAVIRAVDGCAVRQVVRFNVSDRSAADRADQPPPTPGFTGTLVPEGPAATTTPARR